MDGYGWDSYDPRHGGSQTIHDAGNSIDLTTDFAKFSDRGSNGGSWGARIKGVPRPDAPQNIKTTVVFYLALEGFGSLEPEGIEGDVEEFGYSEDITFRGQTNDLGDFSVKVTDGTGNHPSHTHASAGDDLLDHTRVHSYQVPEAALWQAKCKSRLPVHVGKELYLTSDKL